MPLSEHEQRTLEKIEQMLSKDGWLRYIFRHWNVPLLPERVFQRRETPARTRRLARSHGEQVHRVHHAYPPESPRDSLLDHPWRNMPTSIAYTGLILAAGFGTLLGLFSLLGAHDPSMGMFLARVIGFAVVIFFGGTGAINQLRKSIFQRSNHLRWYGYTKVFALIILSCILLSLVPLIP